MTHLVFERLDLLQVIVQDDEAPEPAEWRAYIDSCRGLDDELGPRWHLARAIIFTDGGLPTAPQRHALGKVLRGRPSASAIVTNNLFVRMTMGGFSIINPQLKAFSASEWHEAAQFAHVSRDQHAQVLEVARRLAQQVPSAKLVHTLVD